MNSIARPTGPSGRDRESPAGVPSAFAAGATVLLAVDGTSASEAAARVALDLAERRGARVHVLTVVDTRPAPMPPPLDVAIAIAHGAFGDSVHEEQKRELRIALST